MESKQESQDYFEDLTAIEEDSQVPKKGSTQRRGHFSTYTHFVSIPLLGEEIKAKMLALNKEILLQSGEDQSLIKFQSPELFHISIAMLNLKNETMKKAAQEALTSAQESIKNLLKETPLVIQLGGLDAFMDKKGGGKNALPKLLYLNLIKKSNTELIDKVTNCVIRALLEKEVIEADNLQAMNVQYDHTASLFRPTIYHATFMRIKNTPERKYDAAPLIEKTKDTIFDEYKITRLDISTRFEFAEDKFYKPLHSIQF